MFPRGDSVAAKMGTPKAPAEAVIHFKGARWLRGISGVGPALVDNSVCGVQTYSFNGGLNDFRDRVESFVSGFGTL